MDSSGDALRICDIPTEERPRERLWRVGAAACSSAELLAIILRMGAKGDNAMALASRLLSRFGGVKGLGSATVSELCRLRGVGPTKAVQVLASIELGRRALSECPDPGIAVRSPKEVFTYLGGRMSGLDREHFLAIFLNTRSVVVGEATVSIGSLNASLVHPRELFKDAVRNSAASVILVHNHPSGDPTPSKDDIHLTRRLAECGELMGISVLDHVIVTDLRYYSMKESGHF